MQARRLWEAVLYAQPRVRTDQGLATLAQQVKQFPAAGQDSRIDGCASEQTAALSSMASQD